jgi:hypothetical protein
MSNHATHSSSPLTSEQIERSKNAAKQNLHSTVRPDQLFSAASSSMLAAQVQKEHPVLYRKLKLQWGYDTGAIRRPDPVAVANPDDLIIAEF